jgi:perosamine synthetase
VDDGARRMKIVIADEADFTGSNLVNKLIEEGHEVAGFNYRMTNIQAAIGLAKFERIDELVERRRRNAYLYNSLLKDVGGIRLPPEKEWAKNVYWMYAILIEDEFGMSRDALVEELVKRGIETRAFFIPMHEQPVFHNMGLFKGERYPVAEELSMKGIFGVFSDLGLSTLTVREVAIDKALEI